MSRLEEFISNVKALVNNSARRITTDPLNPDNGYEFALPTNDFVLISGKCGTRVKIENKSITKYILISNNMITFNQKLYALVYVIQEDRGNNKRKTYMHLSGAETLAVRCGDAPRLIEPVGENCAFIAEPSCYVYVHYAVMETPSVFVRQEGRYDITSKLTISFKEDGMYIAPKATEPSQ